MALLGLELGCRLFCTPSKQTAVTAMIAVCSKAVRSARLSEKVDVSAVYVRHCLYAPVSVDAVQ